MLVLRSEPKTQTLLPHATKAKKTYKERGAKGETGGSPIRPGVWGGERAPQRKRENRKAQILS